MQQKIIFLICLITGISLLSCKKTIDYVVKLNYIFVNNTTNNISFNGEANVLNVKAMSESKYSLITEGAKESTKENFRFPVINFCNPCVVYFDNTRCDTLKGAGIESIENYEFTRIKEREYELKYIFTDKDFQRSKACK